MPYEKIGKNEPVCIADEVPFDIPESWEWTRIGNVFQINPRNNLPDELETGFVPMALLSDGFCSRHSYEPKKWKDIKNGFTHFANNDIVIAKITPCFQNRKSAVVTGLPNGFGAGTTELHVLRDNTKELFMPYFLLICKTQAFIQNGVKNFSGTAGQQRIGKDFISKYLIPVPSVSEQERIVQRLHLLEPLLISYENAYDSIVNQQKNFPAQLKRSILQYAVQGKLVSQNPADEPAAILLEHIRAEKEKLIKSGKIKRDKHESVIFRRDNSYYEISGKNEVCIDDQIPFDVPESWEWTRTGSLFQVNPRNRLPDDLDAGFMPMPLLSDGFGNHHDFQIRKWKEIKTGFTHFADGDIVIAKITPCFQNRKSAVISGLPNGVGAGTTELHVLRDHTKKLFMPYCLLIYKTHAFIEKGMKNFSGTAGQQRIGKELISDYLIPIPPLEEQKRIVSAVESIFKKLDDLLD